MTTPEARAPQNQGPATHPTTGRHIVVVDDDRDIRSLLTQFLEKHGFRVTAVADGRSLRRLMSMQRIDLVVLDVMLPGGEDGFAAGADRIVGDGFLHSARRRAGFLWCHPRSTPSRIVREQFGGGGPRATYFQPGDEELSLECRMGQGACQWGRSFTAHHGLNLSPLHFI